MIEESLEIKVMRNMAWERMKGEAKSILHSFYSSEVIDNNYMVFEDMLNDFIETVELKGLLD